MKTVLLLTILLAFMTVAFAQEYNDVEVAQEWNIALGKAVRRLIHQGETDPRLISERASELARSEENKLRQVGKSKGLSDKQLNRSISRDRKRALKSYIDDALRSRQVRGSPAAPENGILAFLQATKTVEAHPKLLRWGFKFTTPTDTRSLLKLPVAQSADELVACLRREPEAVRRHGIALVVPAHVRLTERDKRLVSDLKQTCRREGIPLFLQTDMEDSWTKIN